VDQVPAIGFNAFLSQADFISKTVLLILLVMSIMTWYLILTKALHALRIRERSTKFLQTFWNAPSLQTVAAQLEKQHADKQQLEEPLSNLAYHAVIAVRHHQRHGVNRLNEAGTGSEFLTRAMRRVIDDETARFESGLTVLASVGSTAPFVGLFGTVWGIYHALMAIGISGQGTLDKVAGPVGESLIMTAFGLAVAIPAVLSYNACVRWNRVMLAQLDSFAHDLFAFLTTGSHLNELAAPTAPNGIPAVKGV
jgi:biopolymer transport protein ExbB